MEHKKRLASSRYITGIDGLRAIAVIGVILYHLIPFNVPGGFLGVVIFLVLTGYLITDLLVQEWDQNGHIDLKSFYRRRVTRLYPALVTMLFSTAAYITLFQRQLLAQLRGILWSNLLYVYNWWQILHGQSYFDRFANNESPFTHLWTLSIEGQLYLIWPVIIVGLLLFIKRRHQIANLLLVLGLLSALLMAWLYVPGHDPSRVYYGTDTRLFAVLFGAALAFIWPSSVLKPKIGRPQWLLLDSIGVVTIVVTIIVYFKLNAQSAFVYRGGMVLFTLMIVLLTAVTVHPGAHVNRWLTNPIFTWIGRRSYGIYLYQFPVMIFYENQIGDIAKMPWLHILIQLILIALISELSYRFVEKPLSHLHWHQMNHAGWRRLWVLPAMAVFVVGLTGAIKAPAHAHADNTPLARTIKRNAKANSTRNAKLIADAKKRKQQPSDSSSANSAATSSSSSSTAPIGDLTAEQTQQAQQLPIVGIGDSVMLDGVDALQKIFPQMIVDASVGRQVSESPAILTGYANKGVLANTVLIGLGTNGAFNEQQLDEIMRTVGAQRQVFWINVRVPTRGWQNTVNNSLQQAAKRWPNLTVIDWYDYSNGHPDWFYDDQVHPNENGKQHYADFIAQQILVHLKH
ncbi:acyltransferase family protein [Loigolactobacillus zhaoyuanensis]|uniref:Acyltransferase family protein n=1 Tax=Loigolactobacillus zhaoyuanensis TaxID=2486017 RepID=A0ABW8U8M8_9LACO|nr:acyltransferase family protein [Loigolactobacillus zhaoyuanensis]